MVKGWNVKITAVDGDGCECDATAGEQLSAISRTWAQLTADGIASDLARYSVQSASLVGALIQSSLQRAASDLAAALYQKSGQSAALAEWKNAMTPPAEVTTFVRDGTGRNTGAVRRLERVG
jgi:hypothetical protein